MSRGQHSDLLSDRGPWYSTRSKDYLSPSITEATEEFTQPVPVRNGRPPPGRHRKKGHPHTEPPRRRPNPRYVTAAVLTALLAVPTLWMADYIATHDGNERTVQIVNRDAYVPMTLYVHGSREPICVYIQNSKTGWKAWATSEPC